MITKLLNRIGIIWLSLLITLISIVISVVITTTGHMIFGYTPSKLSLSIAIIAPAVIAPTFNFAILTLVMRLHQKERELQNLAIIDELTQVYNRRHILQLADVERNRAIRLKHPMSVAIFDIDFFKNVNDTYGHLGGDVVLKKVAHICKDNARNIDFFGRYGGEEFVFILPETDASTSFEFAERIRHLLENTQFKYNDAVLSITISIGVATLEENENLDNLLLRADKHLYIAKKHGRNTTVAHTEVHLAG